MKVTFEFAETVTYMHSIDVEIPEEKEEEYEEFADSIADKICRCDYNCDRDSIVTEFKEKFGNDNVVFCEDGSPDTEFDAQ